MGTHPIFESDFDCLTACCEMAVIETEIKGDGDDAEGIPLRASVSNNQGDKIADSSDECSACSRTSSSSSSLKDGKPMCRICHSNSGLNKTSGSRDLITPCKCNGTLKMVHRNCLERWVRTADTKSCELCHYRFDMKSSFPPFRNWKSLTMSSNERKKLIMSITFHIIALGTVVWSLYVLIEKTQQELAEGDMKWAFWAKLIVVGVGFTGGLVFMYVQCRVYVDLIRRFKNENKVIYVQSLPSSSVDEV